MIINIILFFFFYLSLYSSTPSPNDFFIKEDFSHLFTGEDKENLTFRYKNLQGFYRENFSFFLKQAFSLIKDDLEQYLLRDEYYVIFSLTQNKNKQLMEEIQTFFNSLIDSNQKKYSDNSRDKELERSGKKELLRKYLPGIFYALLYTKVTSATEDYNFFKQSFSLRTDDLPPEQSKIIEGGRDLPRDEGRRVEKSNESSGNSSHNHYINEENSKNISPQGFLASLPKNLFHRYFTPFEILTLSSFLIKKFVRPSVAKKFLNDYFGTNFSKKQGVRYLEKYLLPYSGKLFIGGTIFHALLEGSQSIKKELHKLEKIEKIEF